MSALLELGAGFHPELSGRENVYLNGAILGLSKTRARRPVRRDRRLRRARAVHRHAGQELLVRHVRAPRLRRRRQRRSRHPDHRRGARRRRRELPAQVHGEDRRRSARTAARSCSCRTASVMVRNICDRAVWLSHGKLRGHRRPGEVINTYAGTAHEDSAVVGAGHPLGVGRGPHHQDRAARRPGQTPITPLPHRRHRDAAPALQRPPADRPTGVRHRPSTASRASTSPDRTRVTAVSSPTRSTARATSTSTFDRLTLLPGTLRRVGVALRLQHHALLRPRPPRASASTCCAATPNEEHGVVTLNPQWWVDALEAPCRGARSASR